MKNDFYVYAYIDPRDGVPFYIGKGCRGRDRSHFRLCHKKPPKGKQFSFFYKKLRKLARQGVEPIVSRLIDKLEEQEAFFYETFFILALGRRDRRTGPLCNGTDGGEGNSGRIVSEEERRRRSQVSSAVLSTPAARKRMSEAAKNALDNDPSIRQRMSARTSKRYEDPSERQRTSEAVKAALASPAARKRMSEAARKCYEDNPALRDRHSELMKAVASTPEWQAKVAAGVSASWKDDGTRKRRIDGLLFALSSVEYKQAQSARMSAIMSSPEARDRNSVAQQKRYEDPSERQRTSEAVKAALASPAARKRMSEAARKCYEDNPALRDRASKRTKKQLEDDPERLQKCVSTLQRIHSDPDLSERRKIAAKRATAIKPPTSGALKGVLFDKRRGRYSPRFACNGHTYNMPSHKDAAIAGRIYDAIARFIYGNEGIDCYVNFPMIEEWWENDLPEPMEQAA